MKELAYRRMTYDLTMHFAETVVKQNEGMVFCYVSGGGTDSTEKGRQMWARVKGKTENDLMKLPFKKAPMMRPSIYAAYAWRQKNAERVQTYYVDVSHAAAPFSKLCVHVAGSRHGP